jgi:hypothetical protein
VNSVSQKRVIGSNFVCSNKYRNIFTAFHINSRVVREMRHFDFYALYNGSVSLWFVMVGDQIVGHLCKMKQPFVHVLNLLKSVFGL